MRSEICKSLKCFHFLSFSHSKSDYSRDFSICNENQTYVKEIWELILPSFSAYFINKSYNKLEQSIIIETKIEINDINANEVVRLYPLGNTNSSIVELIYHIELGQLFALKSFFGSECKKLYEREVKNY